FFKQITLYMLFTCLEFNRVLLRSVVIWIGINIFPIHHISALLFFLPFHSPSPTIHISVSSAQRKYPIILSVKIPFIENGYPVLKRHIREVIVIIIDRVLVIEIIYT